MESRQKATFKIPWKIFHQMFGQTVCRPVAGTQKAQRWGVHRQQHGISPCQPLPLLPIYLRGRGCRSPGWRGWETLSFVLLVNYQTFCIDCWRSLRTLLRQLIMLYRERTKKHQFSVRTVHSGVFKYFIKQVTQFEFSRLTIKVLRVPVSDC